MTPSKYDKFLNKKPKVFGVDILDYYWGMTVWVLGNYTLKNDILAMIVTALFMMGLFYYKKNFPEHYLFFRLNKREFTKFEVGNKS